MGDAPGGAGRAAWSMKVVNEVDRIAEWFH
jgi:hypothetical protein